MQFYCQACKATVKEPMRYYNSFKNMHLCSKHYHWYLSQGKNNVTDGFNRFDERGKDDNDDNCCGKYSCN